MLKLGTTLVFFSLAGTLFADDAPPAPDASTSAAAPASQSDDREARLTTVEGSVYIHLHDHRVGEFIGAEQDAPLEEGDLVRTGTDGHAELTLDGESVIDLGPNTDFLVESLAKEDTQFHIGIGSIAAKIKTLLQGHSMSFHTATAVAAVRGTELGISQEADDKPAQIGVFDEGHVSVTTPEGANEVKLGPGQETAVERNAAPSQPRALQSFAAQRDRMQNLRRRQEFMRRNWQARTPQQRRAMRQVMRQRRRLRAQQLRNVRADIARRRYARQQQRRMQIQQRIRQLRRQRAQRMKNEQRQRQLQQRQLQRQRRQQEQRQEQQKKAMQQQRQRQAEEHRQAMQRRQQEQERLRQQEAAKNKAAAQRFEQARAERERRREEQRKQVVAQRQQRRAQLQAQRKKKQK